MLDIAGDCRQVRLRGLADLTRTAEQMFAASQPAFFNWMNRAWVAKDLNTLLAGGEVLRRQGQLNGKILVRVGLALIIDERFADAAEVLAQAPADGPNHPAWLGLTEALAGLGRFEEACEAYEQVLVHTPQSQIGGQYRRLYAELKPLAEVQGRISGSPSAQAGQAYQDWRAYIDGCLSRGARAAAADAAQRLLSADDALAGASKEESAVVLRAALDVDDGRFIAASVERLREQHPDDDELHAIQIESDIRRGRASTAMASLRRRPAKDPENRSLGIAEAAVCEALGQTEGAAQALARLAGTQCRDREILGTLSKRIGEVVLQAHDTSYRASGGRKVFNLFPFNNELTLLKIRMAEMAEWVDYFVLVEANETFTGLSKPSHFEEHKDEFREFESKILHVRIDHFPDYLTAPWGRDYYQRDMAVTALAGLWGPEDVIIMTDADEIIRRHAVETFDAELMGVLTSKHRFFFNYSRMNGDVPASICTNAICRAAALRTFGCSYLRFFLARARKGWNTLPDGGWHFSSLLGTPEEIARKYASYAHTEVAANGWTDANMIADVLGQIRRGDFEAGWARREIDETFPAYVRDHREELAQLIL